MNASALINDNDSDSSDNTHSSEENKHTSADDTQPKHQDDDMLPETRGGLLAQAASSSASASALSENQNLASNPNSESKKMA